MPTGKAAPKEEPKSIGRVHKEDYRIFYGPCDKGAAKPAFCYPQRIESLEEEVKAMERSIEMGHVTAERKMLFKNRLEVKKKRLDEINENTERVQKIVNDNKDYWANRREDLASLIRRGTPSRKDVKDRRVNPFTVLKREKGTAKERGLGDIKKEYIVISRALGEESNITFLQRD